MTDLRGVWAERLSKRNLLRLIYGLAAGAAGGFVAHWAGLPLAWMLGPLFACMALSLAGQPAFVPIWFRTVFLSLIGLFLGESFSTAAATELSRWPITLLAAVVYVPVAGGACYLLLRHVARMDKGSALLCGLPGGLTAVSLFAMEMGGDERRVALSHSLRVSFVVLAAPAIAFGWLGLPPPDVQTFGNGTIMPAADFALLAAASVVGAWAVRRLGWPLPHMLGPLFASAALRLPGVIEGTLPGWTVEVALLVCGASIGTRFHGVPLRFFASTFAWTAAATLLLMTISLAFAGAVSAWMGVDFFAALLAYAPGGVAEMSLIAIAIDADPAFVAAHHMARIFAILFSLPLLASHLRRLLEEDPGAA